MFLTARRMIGLAAPLLLIAAAATAQEPQLVNGQLTPGPSAPATAATVRQLVAAPGANGPAWIGYRVPMIPGDRTACCGSWDGRVPSPCRLERDGGSMMSSGRSGAGTVARIEPSTTLFVLYRVVDRAVERIVPVSADCAIDAGGRPITWLGSMPARESVTLLESFVTADAGRRNRLGDGATSSIALHAGPEADAALTAMVQADRPVTIRRQATFWLGNARAAAGLQALERVLRDDPSAEVRKAAVFGVSQSPEPRAAGVLAGLARDHAEPAVRSEALFWAAQSGRPDAAPLALEALERDPSPEVRKKAIFALSQLKDDAGIEPLINVARTHQDPAVRSEAIFWLGQKAGKAAAGAITERIDADPETEVKKRAVFALSQLPADEGVPLLIDVARTNTNPVVRKQAMFWLGQSKDPRALDFFADVLAGRSR